MKQLISLAAMLVILVLAFTFDGAFELARLENARTFDLVLLVWRSILLELAFAVSIFALGWLFLIKSEKSSVLSLVFVIVGLLLLSSWPVRILFPTAPIEPPAPLNRFVLVSPTTFEFHAAAFIAIMGAIGLVQSVTAFRAGTRARKTASSI